ncbi:MAG: NAD(P)/FAD-dependent oxidoreductase [Rhodobiaceae bacterium]|nr:NAD(P)/FAD-dependent oxidoreductase [Rhodobiaceae bacterium]
MNMIDRTALQASDAFNAWLEKFGGALERANGDEIASFFAEDSHWKDILSFTWEHRTISGKAAIAKAFAATAKAAKITNVSMSPGRTAPKQQRRSGSDVLEGYFDFDTGVGSGSAFVRLLYSPDGSTEPRIWFLLTTLQSLKAHPEPVGRNRPSGDEFAKNELGRSWRQERERQQGFEDREPEVIIVGAGQAGLTIAARLGRLGVDALVIERLPRVGDVWRQRYESLTLHNEVMANHLPYMPFPENWPLWLTKDHMAIWLEAYAEFLEANVWTSTELAGARYDETTSQWTVELVRDGKPRTVHCRHIVIATGASGGLPHIPKLPGIDAFKGSVTHSSDFKNGADFKGRKVIVVGTGNSGHDIAQDLFVKGAEKVWMLQRSPCCVVSLEPTAAMVYKIYGEGMPTEDVDLITASVPYPVMEDTYRWITEKGAKLDEEMLEGLAKAGFRTYFGSDGTGFQMKFMRGEGNYYIDVGNVELIVNGSVGVIQYDDAEGFVAEGLKMKDGSVIACDDVILATGFKNMQETVRKMLGSEIADSVGPLWGFDENYQMRNMWRRTAQPGLWFTGGSLLDSRLYSRFLAIELRAELDGVLPAKENLPLH